MDNEILQKTIMATIDRFAKQVAAYETEIANLNIQKMILENQLAQAQSQLTEALSARLVAKDVASTETDE